MWFLSARKAQRAPPARCGRNTSRPRIEALEDRCLLSAGALDPTFGNGGLVLTANGLNMTNAVIQAVVVQTDGKIVIAGHIAVNGLFKFALERYNADGTPDSSFGINGAMQTVVGAGGSGINGLALQSDGKIVAVGLADYSVQPLDSEFAVARYNANGSLDTTFGNGGIVTTNLVTPTRLNAGYDTANAVAIQGDGKIDVAGYSSLGNQTTFSEQFALVRYNANGTLDTTFGSHNNPGIVITPTFSNGGDSANALAVQSDGKILLVGSTFNPGAVMAAARYTSTGQLDSSFGTSGIAMGVAPSGSTAFANGVLVQSNGAIVVAGYSYAGTSSTLTLARLTSTGHLDTTFGGSNTGFAVNSFMSQASAIAQGANGDLLVAGRTQNSNPNGPSFHFGVTAFLQNGALDTTFGTTTPPNGTATADFSGGYDWAHAMAIQGDGKIVAAGFSNLGGQTEFALARFLPPNTKIGSFTANPNPVAAGSSLTLTVSNILNSNPTSTISNVVFYLDSIGGTPLAVTLISNTNGTWTYSLDTTGMAAGSHTLYAQAVDNYGFLSDPLAIPIHMNPGSVPRWRTTDLRRRRP